MTLTSGIEGLAVLKTTKVLFFFFFLMRYYFSEIHTNCNVCVCELLFMGLQTSTRIIWHGLVI